MRLGLLKTMPKFLDLEYNLEVLRKMVPKAAAEGVELLVTCEAYLDGYCAKLNEVDRERLASVAQRDNSPLLTEVQTLCRENGIGMVFGYSSLSDDGVKNTAMLIGPDGSEIGRYHKTHLLYHDEKYVPGDAFPVFDTQWGRIGLLICADRRWPEAARALRCAGAQIILIPTYGFHNELNRQLMCARAYENECYVAFAHPEQSFLCNPAGAIEAYLESSAAGILVHDVDLSKCRNEMFSYRRADLYGTPNQ